GSIRVPASCCGLVGLKPTRGRFIDGEQARSMPVNIVGEGVLTRTVRDTAAFFAGMEQTWRNRRLPAIGHVDGPGTKRLRIGLVAASVTGIPTSAETRTIVEGVARLLESLGHRVEEMPLPVTQSFVGDFTLYWGFLAFMVALLGRHTFGREFD